MGCLTLHHQGCKGGSHQPGPFPERNKDTTCQTMLGCPVAFAGSDQAARLRGAEDGSGFLLRPRRPSLNRLRFSRCQRASFSGPQQHYSCFTWLTFKRGLLSSSKLHEMEEPTCSKHTQASSVKEQRTSLEGNFPEPPWTPPPASHIGKKPFRGRSKPGVNTVAKSEGTALGPPVTAFSCTRFLACRVLPLTQGTLMTTTRGRNHFPLAELQRGSTMCPRSSTGDYQRPA